MGTARSCPSGANYITVGATADLSIVTNLTLAAWVHSGAAPGTYTNVLEHSRLANNWYGLWRKDTAAGGEFHFRWAHTAAGPPFALDFNTSTSVNTWYHVCGVKSGANVNVYLNGVNDGSVGGASTCIANNVQTRIGANNSGTESLLGHVCHVHIYNVALNVGQVNEIMHKPGSYTNGLKLYLPLWGIHSPEPDLSGLGHSGTVTLTTEVTATGPPIRKST